MNLIRLWDKDGKAINLDDYGLLGLSLIPESPSYSDETETMDGMDGAISLGKQLNPRRIEANFLVEAHNYEDSLMLRDDLYSLFSGGESFYIGEVDQPGKSWFVQNTDSWTPERLNAFAYLMTLNLTCLKGVAESVFTTLTPFEWDEEAWQFGMGIPFDNFKYQHNTNLFEIYNAGKRVINPRSLHTKIKITIEATASSYLELINLTTGETYRYDGALNSNDKLVIDGIRSTKNALSVLRNTNKRLITLAPGANKFEIKGTSSIKNIGFDFKFYYD